MTNEERMARAKFDLDYLLEMPDSNLRGKLSLARRLYMHYDNLYSQNGIEEAEEYRDAFQYEVERLELLDTKIYRSKIE